jgi:hypothetical protein
LAGKGECSIEMEHLEKKDILKKKHSLSQLSADTCFFLDNF